MSLIIPNTFANKTGQVQLGLLDENFTYLSNLTIGDITGNATSGSYLRGNGTSVVMSPIQLSDLPRPVSGNWFNGGLTLVGTDGMMEVGRYIDFHSTDTSTADFDARIDCSGTNAITFGSATVTAAGFRAPDMNIQTVYKVYTANTTYSVLAYAAASDGTSNGTYIDVLNTTITPKLSTSRIKIELNISFEVHHSTVFRLFRSTVAGGDVQIGKNDNNNRWSGWALPGYDVDNATTGATNHYVYIDTPATTAAVTYKFMIQSAGVAAITFYLNRTVNSAGAADQENAISQVILTEIV